MFDNLFSKMKRKLEEEKELNKTQKLVVVTDIVTDTVTDKVSDIVSGTEQANPIPIPKSKTNAISTVNLMHKYTANSIHKSIPKSVFFSQTPQSDLTLQITNFFYSIIKNEAFKSKIESLKKNEHVLNVEIEVSEFRYWNRLVSVFITTKLR